MIPPDHPDPVRLFAQDESRWSLRTIPRRRITARGVNPEGETVFSTETTWLYGCIDPLDGESFFLILPTLNAAMMQRFLDTFADTYADSFNILLMDNSTAHTAKTLCLPANVALVFQPPHCPEVNPAERVWQDMRGKLAWQNQPDLTALEDVLVDHIHAYDPATLQSLTAYPYLVEAYYAACL